MTRSERRRRRLLRKQQRKAGRRQHPCGSHGLGCDPEHVDALVNEGKKKTAQEMAASEPQANTHGGDRKSEEAESTLYNNLEDRGTSASYLVRRLKRDAPDVADALARGEYKSARAAGIAAGIVHVPSPLEIAQKAYRLEQLLRGTEAWETFLELTRGEPGGDNNPYGCKGKPKEEPEINCDNITVDSTPKPNPPPPTGTSVSYSLRRLSRKRPDIYERVKSGEISAHAAMYQHGQRRGDN